MESPKANGVFVVIVYHFENDINCDRAEVQSRVATRSYEVLPEDGRMIQKKQRRT